MARRASNPTPIVAIVLLLTGGALLVLYFKGYTSPSALVRLIHFGSAVVLIVAGISAWGSVKLIDHRWTRYLPYQVTLTRPGMAYLIIMITVFVSALMGRSNLLLLVFGLLSGPVVLNGSVTLAMLKRNQVLRQMPERVQAGETFYVELTLQNQRYWLASWLMVVEDQIRHGGATILTDPPIVYARVPPRGERTARYEVRLMNRGTHEFGPIRLSTQFPLGFVERAYTLRVPGTLLVYPALGRLRPAWRRELERAWELAEETRARAGTFEDEFHSLREFRSGDNPRAIHWRTSARRNSLMIREYHQTRDDRLALFVDLWQPASAGDADKERVERALSFAATVCADCCTLSRESGLFVGLAGKTTSTWSGPAGPRSLPSLLDRLAVAEAGPAANLASMLPDWRTTPRARSRVVLVTTRAAPREPPGMDELLREMRLPPQACLVISSASEEMLRYWTPPVPS
jgi:uncharacterized protein (DUF58 family)